MCWMMELGRALCAPEETEEFLRSFLPWWVCGYTGEGSWEDLVSVLRTVPSEPLLVSLYCVFCALQTHTLCSLSWALWGWCPGTNPLGLPYLWLLGLADGRDWPRRQRATEGEVNLPIPHHPSCEASGYQWLCSFCFFLIYIFLLKCS